LKHFSKYLAVWLLILLGCDGNEPKRTDIGLDYFPLRKGFFQIYTIEGTQYSEISDPEDFQYELQVEVIDSFPNTAGSYTYVLHRSKRADQNEAWEFMDSWSARIDDNEVVQQEGNISFLKLILPVRNGTTWNGNKYNNNDDDEYVMKMVNEPFTAGNTTYERTLMVDQENNEDPIVFRDIRKEVYAREAGLIHKEITQLHYCTNDGCLGKQEIESGITYKQQIKEYGIR
jgi:hypothetical protein